MPGSYLLSVLSRNNLPSLHCPTLFICLSNIKLLEVIKILQCISYNMQRSLCPFCLNSSCPLLYLANPSNQVKYMLEDEVFRYAQWQQLPCHLFQMNFVNNLTMKTTMFYCKCLFAFLLPTKLWLPWFHTHLIFSLYLYSFAKDCLLFYSTLFLSDPYWLV